MLNDLDAVKEGPPEDVFGQISFQCNWSMHRVTEHGTPGALGWPPASRARVSEGWFHGSGGAEIPIAVSPMFAP